MSTWAGFAYVAFVATYARRILGWRVATIASMVLDAIEQAILDPPTRSEDVIHHTDRISSDPVPASGSPSEHQPSVGAVDSYDNAPSRDDQLGLYKTS